MNDVNTLVNGDENPNPIDETPAAGDAWPASHSRTGKIARLPLTLRRQLNRRLRDGQAGQTVLAWLNGLPEVQAIMTAEFQGQPIRKQNLSRWRMGGYKEALAEEETRQEVASLLEEIGGLRAAAQDGLTDQLAFYLAVQAALELKRLKAVPDGGEKVKLWREARTSLVALRRGDIELERLRLQREKFGLSQQTREEREKEFWKWAEENINRDEFCRRRCFTYEQREAAVNKILGITPEERGETGPQDAADAAGETEGDNVPPSPA